MKLTTHKVTVPFAASANIQVICERGPFQMKKLIVPPEQAQHFAITDIKVGKNSQFVTPGAIPASFFTEENQSAEIKFDALPRGGYITISVTNISTKNEAVKGESTPIPPPERTWLTKLLRIQPCCPPMPRPLSPQTPDPEPKTFSATLEGDVVDVSPHTTPETRNRVYILGLGLTIIRPHSKAQITLQSQVTFNPYQLILPKELLSWAQVNELRIVGEPMQLTPERLTQGHITFAGPLVRPSDWMSILVENTSDSAHGFMGTILGSAS